MNTFFKLLFCSFSISLFFIASLSAQNQAAVTKKATELQPIPHQKKLEQALRRGVDFLIAFQNKNGSWGNARNTKGLNIYCPIPSGHKAFQVAASSLCISGLIDSRDQRQEVQQAIKKGEQFLLSELPKIKRTNAECTYNNWAHAYGLRALVDLAERQNLTEEQKKQYKKIAAQQLNWLYRCQDVDGGWGYLQRESITRRPSAGSMGFKTATVLLAIQEAKQTFQLSFDKKREQQALLSIRIQQTPDFSYVYAMEHRRHARIPINRPAGSLARTQTCNAALRLYGDKKITDAVILQCVERFIKRIGWLELGIKKPIPHESHFGVSGYFYCYGHYYTSECLQWIPEKKRKKIKWDLLKIIAKRQEKDGSWWDYPLYNYHKAYGTGYMLTALSRLH